MSKTSNNHRRRYKKVKPERPFHRALWQRKDCPACERPVIMAEEQLGGGRLRGAVLDGEPDPRGALVRGADGYVTRDYDRAVAGKRWRWHDCPARK